MKIICLTLLFLVGSSRAWTGASKLPRAGQTSLYSAEPTMSQGVHTLDGEEIRGAIEPLGNNILVRVKDTLTATEGGVLLPDQSKERPTEGLVIASGPGKIHPFTAVRIHNPIKEGMSVLYGKFDGRPINYDDDICQMIKDDNCLLYYDGVTMNIQNVVPVRDYVLIELYEDPETLATTSGVVIASQVMADDVPCEGVVVKVGEGRMASNGECTPSPVAVGDSVKFKDYAGNDVKIDGKAYSLVKMVDILGTLSEES
mmetsp:Transcript_18410/g.45626  ORF Transcript_18410/g.45626 Transcript_18410/m.45626 type:complete len:257 (-) Transcript_18410:1350-2120(-)